MNGIVCILVGFAVVMSVWAKDVCISFGTGKNKNTDNEGLKAPKALAGRIDAKCLNAFLSMKSSEKTKLDEGKCNAFRSVLDLPLQGTITTKCDMFCNHYPLEEVLKLFGALAGKDAQAVK